MAGKSWSNKQNEIKAITNNRREGGWGSAKQYHSNDILKYISFCFIVASPKSSEFLSTGYVAAADLRKANKFQAFASSIYRQLP